MSHTAETRTNLNRVGLLVVLGISAFYFLVPLWWLVVAATKRPGFQFAGSGLWFKGFSLWANIHLLDQQGDGIFWRWMLNSLLYAGSAAVIGTLLASLCGYALAKYDFRGRGFVFGSVLAAVLVPKVLLTMPLFLMFHKIGLLNNPLAVIIPFVVSPFGVYLARVFAAQSVPDELIEAARLDGASEFKIFFRVAAPVMVPSLVTIMLFQFVDVWNNYLLPAMLLNDSSLQTVTVGMVGWSDSNSQVPAGTVVVAAFVSIVPLIIAFLSLQRYWRAGLTAGALK